MVVNGSAGVVEEAVRTGELAPRSAAGRHGEHAQTIGHAVHPQIGQGNRFALLGAPDEVAFEVVERQLADGDFVVIVVEYEAIGKGEKTAVGRPVQVLEEHSRGGHGECATADEHTDQEDEEEPATVYIHRVILDLELGYRHSRWHKVNRLLNPVLRHLVPSCAGRLLSMDEAVDDRDSGAGSESADVSEPCYAPITQEGVSNL